MTQLETQSKTRIQIKLEDRLKWTYNSYLKLEEGNPFKQRALTDYNNLKDIYKSLIGEEYILK